MDEKIIKSLSSLVSGLNVGGRKILDEEMKVTAKDIERQVKGLHRGLERAIWEHKIPKDKAGKLFAVDCYSPTTLASVLTVMTPPQKKLCR